LYESDRFKDINGLSLFDPKLDAQENYYFYTIYLPNKNVIGSNARLNYSYLSGIKYIQIVQEQTNVYLNLADITAFEPNSETVNIIPSTAISVREIDNKPYLSGYPWTNIIDNNFGTFGHHGDTSSCTVEITLKDVKTLSIIELINRGECCRMRLVGAYIKLLDSNRNVIYISDKMKDKLGNVVYNTSREQNDNNNGLRDSWYVYTFFLPNTTVYGNMGLRDF
jgi:hypothetical protein